MKTKGVIYCGLFTALIAVGAFIKIPIPVVPFTLQYLFTMLAGLLLGSRLGTLSVLSYMLLGLAGLPIFSEGGGIYHRICRRNICNRVDRRTHGKKDHNAVSDCKPGGTFLRVCNRHDLLLYHL